MHLSELHGAATHLAVVAIPVYVIVLLLRRTRGDHPALGQAEPWLLGAALAGVAAAGVTGLLVWGQAQTMLRGHSFRIGTAHFWLGIGLAVVLAAMAVARWRAGTTLLAGAVVATAVVVLQGYLGGRMTYDQGVGIAAAGQFAQSASGAAGLEAALARGTSEVAAGRKAFSTDGLGCASCHGDRAQGQRGPRLAGGAQLEDFRRKHADGLFPPRIVSDADFRAVDAWLRSLR